MGNGVKKVLGILLVVFHFSMILEPASLLASDSSLIPDSNNTSTTSQIPVDQANSFQNQNYSNVEAMNQLLQVTNSPAETYTKESVNEAKSLFIVAEYLWGTKFMVSMQEHALEADKTKGQIKKRTEYERINDKAVVTKIITYDAGGAVSTVDSTSYDDAGNRIAKVTDRIASDIRDSYTFASNGLTESYTMEKLSDGTKIKRMVYAQVNGKNLTSEIHYYDTLGNPSKSVLQTYNTAGIVTSKQTLDYTINQDNTYIYRADGSIDCYIQKNLSTGVLSKKVFYISILGKDYISDSLVYDANGILSKKDSDSFDANGLKLSRTSYDFVAKLIHEYIYNSNGSLNTYTKSAVSGDSPIPIQQTSYTQTTAGAKASVIKSYDSYGVLAKMDSYSYSDAGVVAEKISTDYTKATVATSRYDANGLLKSTTQTDLNGSIQKEILYVVINGKTLIGRQNSFNGLGNLLSVVRNEFDAAGKTTLTRTDNYTAMTTTIIRYNADGTNTKEVIPLVNDPVPPVNAAPIITVVSNAPLLENTATSVTLQVSDENQDTLEISYTGLPQGAVATSHFNEETSFYEVVINWTPTFNQAGSYPITIHVSDGLLDTHQELALVVENLNRTPSVAWPVHNSSDASTDQGLQLAANQTVTFRSGTLDQDGDLTTWAWLLNGATMQEGSGSLQNFSLDLSLIPNTTNNRVTIIVTDSYGASSQKYITFTVLPAPAPVPPPNQIPVISPVSNIPAQENSPAAVSFRVSDPEHDALNFTFDGMPQGATANVQFDSATFIYLVSIVWTPGFDQSGTHSITMHANDGSHVVDHPFSIVVENTNRPPSASLEAPEGMDISDEAGLQLSAGQTVTFRSATTDPDSDSMTRVWMLDGVALASSSPELALDLSALSTNAPHTLVFRAIDSHEAMAEETIQFSVIPVNVAPTVSTLSSPVLTENSAGEFRFSISDANLDSLNISFDGLPSGSVTNTVFNEETSMYECVLSWTPSYNQSGVHSITMHVNDGVHTIDHPFTIEVQNVNRPPQMSDIVHTGADADTSTPGIQFEKNQSIIFSSEILDPDNDSLSRVWTLDGSVMDINAEELAMDLSLLSPSQHHLVLTIRDPQGITVEKAIDFTVLEPINNLPYVAIVTNPEAIENVPTQAIVNISDPDGDGLNISFDGLPEGMTATINPIELSGNSPLMDSNSPTSYQVVFNWTPGSGQEGIHPIMIYVNDGKTVIDYSLSMTVRSENQPPLASIITHNGYDGSAAAGLQFYATQSVIFSSGGVDLDGDGFTWKWVLDGTVVKQGSGKVGDYTRDLSTLSKSAPHTLVILIQDTYGKNTEKIINFNVIDAPAAATSPISFLSVSGQPVQGGTLIAPNHIRVDSHYAYQITSTTQQPALTFKLQGTSGITNIQMASMQPPIVNATGIYASQLPTAPTYSATTGFLWNATPSQAGTYIINFIGQDASGATVTFQIKVTVDAGPVCTESSASCFALKELYDQGLAAGNIGDFYDNLDNEHASVLNRNSLSKNTPFPQVDSTSGAGYGMPTTDPFGTSIKGMTLGNASLGISTPNDSSILNNLYKRTLLPTQTPGTVVPAQERLNVMADGNYMFFGVGTDSYSLEYGDLFLGNSASGAMVSEGASSSELQLLKAMYYMLAAFKPAVKTELLNKGLMTYTLQALFRQNIPLVETPEDYFTSKAHTATFNQYQLVTDESITKMILAAQSMNISQIPPKVTYTTLQSNTRTVDGIREYRYSTSTSSSYLHLGAEQNKTFVIKPASTGVTGQNITYRVVALNGENITVVNNGNGTFTVTVPYQKPQPVYDGSDITTQRIDIGIFADNGSFVSAPAFLSINYRADQIREYDENGRLLEVSYNVVDTGMEVPQSIYYNDKALLNRALETNISDWTAFLSLALPSDAENFQSSIIKEGLNHITDKDGNPISFETAQAAIASFMTSFAALDAAYKANPTDIATQYAVRTALDAPMENMEVSIRQMMIQVLDYLKNDPSFYFDNQVLLSSLMQTPVLGSTNPSPSSEFNTAPITSTASATTKGTADTAAILSYSNGVMTVGITSTQTTSENGVYLSFLDSTSKSVGVNFAQMFPDGMNIDLSSTGGITSVTLEIQSMNPVQQTQIVLNGITSDTKTWHIDLNSLFGSIDLTQVKAMRIKVVGKVTNAQLKIGLKGLTASTTKSTWTNLVDSRTAVIKDRLAKLVSAGIVTLSAGQYTLDESKMTEYANYLIQEINHSTLDYLAFPSLIKSPLSAAKKFVSSAFAEGTLPTGNFAQSHDKYYYDENGNLLNFLRYLNSSSIDCVIDGNADSDACYGYYFNT